MEREGRNGGARGGVGTEEEGEEGEQEEGEEDEEGAEGGDAGQAEDAKGGGGGEEPGGRTGEETARRSRDTPLPNAASRALAVRELGYSQLRTTRSSSPRNAHCSCSSLGRRTSAYSASTFKDRPIDMSAPSTTAHRN